MSFEFDPTGAVLDDETQGAGLKPSKSFSFDPAGAEIDDTADQGFTGTVKAGLRNVGRAIGATTDTYTNDKEGVVEKAQASNAETRDVRLDKFYDDFSENTGMGTENEKGLLGSIGGGLKAVWDNPKGAALAVAEQAPNALPTLGGAYAGMKAGQKVGGARGAIVGGLAGMFLGNTAIETGHKAMGAAGDGEFTDEERGQAMREGAVKGGVITGVDALTLGVGGVVSNAMRRTVNSAVEAATAKALTNAGIDVADQAAVMAARQSPEIAAQVIEAQKNAARLADNLRRRGAEAGTLLAMETVGEGLGEYLGELAATGEASVPEAVLESLMSVGQSGAETAWNMARGKKPQTWDMPEGQEDMTEAAPPTGPLPEVAPTTDPLAAADAVPPVQSAPGAAPKPSERMGLNPEQGALSAAAVVAVDTGATQQLNPLAAPPLEPARLTDQRQETALLPDLREQGFSVDAEGNAVPVRLPNQAPENYRQGGAGMDTQSLRDSRFGNVAQAHRARLQSPNPEQLEVVKLGPKAFALQPKPELGAPNAQVASEQSTQAPESAQPAMLSAETGKPVLQNRDRSTAASVTQMRSIAAQPDYARVSVGRDFGNGAPVVEQSEIVAPERLGRVDVAVTASGRQIPVQYAVVEAGELMASHDINGSPIEGYETGAQGFSRAIAGNGRVTGLKHAYTQGTANEYRAALQSDDLHGINPQVIASMQAPVLVRVMPSDQITANIGDESNTVGVSALSPAEQASNDARRINLDALEFAEDGSITPATVRGFINAMPASEQGGLLDQNGQPARQAADRMQSAVFATVYEDDALVSLQAQAADPEARTVIAGMLRAAPKMARLKGAGDYDIRGLIVEAAMAAVNARREGQSLADYAAQADLNRSPEAQPILDMFAEHARSGKRIGDELSNLADAFYAEASKPENDMFGAVPRRTPNQLLGRDNDSTQGQPENTPSPSDAAGSELDARSDEGQSVKPGKPASAGPVAQGQQPAEPAFGLEAQTEQSLAAQTEAQARADAEQAAQRKAQEDKAAADAEAGDFVLSGSDRPADVAASRGQNDLFGAGASKQAQPEQSVVASSASTPPSLVSTSDPQSVKDWIQYRLQDLKKRNNIPDGALLEETIEANIDSPNASRALRASKINAELSDLKKTLKNLRKWISDNPAAQLELQGGGRLDFADPVSTLTFINNSGQVAPDKPRNLKEGIKALQEKRRAAKDQNAKANPAASKPSEFPLQEAVSSYSGISHSGNSRAKADRDDFNAYIDVAKDAGMAVAKTDAQKQAVEQVLESLRADYLSQYRALMAVRSATYSAFVAGRSGLNSKQADRSNSAYDRAIERFVSWQKANQDSARKAALDARTDEQKKADQNAIQRATSERKQAKEESDRALIRKVLSWKRGDRQEGITKTGVLVGVNYDKDNYPSSLKIENADGTPMMNNKFDLVELYRERGESVAQAKQRVRALVDAVRAESQPVQVKTIEGESIDGDWTRFADDSGSLNIPRSDMPQIKSEHRGAMVNFLNARGIEHAEDTVPAESLKPTQAEFSKNKVETAKQRTDGERSILISSDGHVLDGHHQWLAKREAGEQVKVIRLDAPIRELLPVVAEFPSATQDQASEASATPATTQAQAESEPMPLLSRHVSVIKRAKKGEISAEEFKAAFSITLNELDAIKAELNTMKKDDLLKAGGQMFWYRNKDSKKAEVVEALANLMLQEFALDRSYGPNSYMMTSGGMAAHRAAKQKALADLVENTSQEDLQAFSQEHAAQMAELKAKKEARAKTLENPESLSDFREVMRYHMDRGDDRQQAFMRLTPEQRRQYDALEAESTKDQREQAKAKQRAGVAIAGQTTSGEIIKTTHTKHGHDLWVVRLGERVSREDYQTLNTSAKRMGGYYSAFRGNGAIPGFQFKTADAAEAFSKLVAGDSSDAQVVADARRDAFEDDRSQSAAERLRTMAEALKDRANESLNRSRKVNTSRRAHMAASAEAAARAELALGETMDNLAAAIDSGKAKFLDGVRQKVQVEFLSTELRNAKDAQIRAKYSSYSDQEKNRGEPIDEETVDYAAFPTYTAMRSDLASVARQLLEIDGTKKLGSRLLSVADDVTEAYTQWAKENLHKVSHFGRGDSLATFSNRDEAERAIRRSGIADRAIVLPIKRGENRVILSPSEAMKQGLWNGDGDKRITLSSEFGRELVEAVGRKAGKSVKLPWQLESAHQKRKRLEGMGIFTGSEYRSALREFAEIKADAATPDKIKQKERSMIGRRNDGLDFFPTSEAVIDQMLEAAEIGEGMAVLEPSAGMGHIADKIREKAQVDPDVIELSGERRELLEMKGYLLVGSDFTEVKPRSFFTFGDVFRTADGRLGVMRGQGGLGSDRVRFLPLDENGQPSERRAEYLNRDDLEGVEHRGTQSGYDRIIMNPPFSKGRDIEHVRHAYDLLRPGGRIVAIMGEGAFFNSNKAAENFRSWLDELGATSERLPENSFMDAALPVNTAVNARLVVIDKPSSEAVPSDGVDAALYSRAGLSASSVVTGNAPVKPISVAEAEAAALAFLADYNGNIELDYRIRKSQHELYGPAGSVDKIGVVKGAYHPERGLFTLAADHLSSMEDVRETLRHEILGHYGLDTFTPEDKQALLEKIIASKNDPSLAQAWRRISGLYSDMPEIVQAEEVFAYLAEGERSGKEKLADLLRSVLTRLLRNVFGYKKGVITRSELLREIEVISKGIRNGTRPRQSFDSEANHRRGDQVDTPAFKQWFGDSKVVDKDGKPLVLYHGTAADFTVFDSSRAGKSTGHATSAFGVFMTSDKATAERYADKASDGMPALANVMELFASIKKPYLMSVEESQAVENIVQARALRGRLEKQGYDGIQLKGTSVWIAFNNYQVKSATDNVGTFDEFSADIRFRRSPSQDADLEAMRKLGLSNEEGLSVLEKLRGITQESLLQKIKDLAVRSREGLFDGLAGIQRAEKAVGITDPDQQGYVSARMATGVADVMNGIMRYGAPEWRDGVLQHREGTRGLLEILAELGPDNVNDWLGWLGAKRGQILKAQGRENNLSDKDIADLLARAKGREAQFERVYQEYAKLNEAMLDVLEGAGLLDPETREKWATDYYVPFYRELEEGIEGFAGTRTKRGLSHQTAAIRALKGGNVPTQDLLTNILTGWTKRIDASMKNKALLEIVDNLKGSDYLTDESLRYQEVLVPRAEIAKRIRQDRKVLKKVASMLGLDETANQIKVISELMKPENQGFEKVWSQVAPTDPDIIRVQRNGKNEYYRVNDESLLRGLKHMEGNTFNDPVTKAGRAFKRLLTTGVTASPDFILRNFIRDSAHSWMINKDGFKLGTDSIKGIHNAFKNDADYRALMFAGGSFQGGYIMGNDPEAAARSIRRVLASKGFNRRQQQDYMDSLVNSPAKLGAMLSTGWEKYRELGDTVENANRLSTYKAALAAGKSARQAAFEAKDLMDFSLRGNFAAAVWLTDVVPFLNARMQGLYKLGRAMKGDKSLIAKEVARKGAYIAGASILLAFLNGDDERYKALPDWDKDMNWHLFLGDEHFRIPKPFELGLVFGTLPERFYHAIFGDQKASDLGSAAVRGFFETLAFNPVPQFYNPIREIQANRNFFRNMPIEDMGDEGKLPEARYDDRTSALGWLIGQATGPTIGLSPKQVDHLVQGYTGTMGGYVLTLSSVIAAAFQDGESPDSRIGDWPLIKVLYQGNDPRSTKYQSEFYDMMREADQLYRTVNAHRSEGKVELAERLLASNSDKLRHRPALGLARQQMGAIRKQREAVHRDTTMNGATKRARLNELQRKANEIAERVVKIAGDDF